MAISPGSMAERGSRVDLTLPLPLAGEVDALARARQVGEIFIQTSASGCLASTPTPALPRKRERGAQRRKPLHSYHRLAVDLAGAGLRQFVDKSARLIATPRRAQDRSMLWKI
jgi:hypothetical protein